jgi:hypothetical protein
LLSRYLAVAHSRSELWLSACMSQYLLWITALSQTDRSPLSPFDSTNSANPFAMAVSLWHSFVLAFLECESSQVREHWNGGWALGRVSASTAIDSSRLLPAMFHTSPATLFGQVSTGHYCCRGSNFTCAYDEVSVSVVNKMYTHIPIYISNSLSPEGTVLRAATSCTLTEAFLQLLTVLLLGLHFDHEDGGSIVLRKVCVDYTTRRHIPEDITLHSHPGTLDSVDTILQAGRSWVRFPKRSLDFPIYLILPAALWPWGRLNL